MKNYILLYIVAVSMGMLLGNPVSASADIQTGTATIRDKKPACDCRTTLGECFCNV
jgi:hypothetical protein